MTQTLPEAYKVSASIRDWLPLPALSVPSITIILPLLATA